MHLSASISHTTSTLKFQNPKTLFTCENNVRPQWRFHKDPFPHGNAKIIGKWPNLLFVVLFWSKQRNCTSPLTSCEISVLINHIFQFPISSNWTSRNEWFDPGLRCYMLTRQTVFPALPHWDVDLMIGVWQNEYRLLTIPVLCDQLYWFKMSYQRES